MREHFVCLTLLLGIGLSFGQLGYAKSLLEMPLQFSEDAQKISAMRGKELSKFFEHSARMSRKSCQWRGQGQLLYATEQDRRVSLKTWISNLQFLVLLGSIRGLENSPKLVGKGKEIVQRYCSPSMTLFSQKRLANLLEKSFELKKNRNEQEAKVIDSTLELFQAGCSWGQKLSTLRDLGLFLREAMSLGLLANWVEDPKSIFPGPLSEKLVSCDSVVCGPIKRKEALELWPRPLGGATFEEEIQALSCEEFQGLSGDVAKGARLNISFVGQWLEMKSITRISQIGWPAIIDDLITQVSQWGDVKLQSAATKWFYEQQPSVENTTPSVLPKSMKSVAGPWNLDFLVWWGFQRSSILNIR